MKKLALALCAVIVASAGQASAANLAVFGVNNIGSYYSSDNTVTYVTDANLSTAGFLNSYDAFIYTRDGYALPGNGLSAAAAANVKSYVTGNVVLFNGDFSDGLFGDVNTNKLFDNALAYALSGTGGAYIGEFTGAVAAFASNDNGFSPIGLVNGNAGALGAGNGGSNGDVSETPYGVGSSLLNGVSLPYNDTQVEFGSALDGYNPAKAVLKFSNGNPALLASGVESISAGVPEPATWALMIGGFGLAGAALRRRRELSLAV